METELEVGIKFFNFFICFDVMGTFNERNFCIFVDGVFACFFFIIEYMERVIF